MPDEEKMKHLEFIQQVITRMNTNSFLIKGWAVTLVAALFALAAKEANQNYYIIAYIPVVVFWLLDSIYLSLEKRFRILYEWVRTGNASAPRFSMDISNCHDEDTPLYRTSFSKTILLFYGPLIGLTTLIMIKFGY
jgi:hypothetical protein